MFKKYEYIYKEHKVEEALWNNKLVREAFHQMTRENKISWEEWIKEHKEVILAFGSAYQSLSQYRLKEI